MLSNTNIRAVIIALPITLQPEFIKRALEAGKSVLSEKPISKDLESAKALITYYKNLAELNVGGAGNDVGAGGSPKPTWSVAENWRFLDSHVFAAEEIQRLGRVLGFRVRVDRNIQPGSKYFGKWLAETSSAPRIIVSMSVLVESLSRCDVSHKLQVRLYEHKKELAYFCTQKHPGGRHQSIKEAFCLTVEFISPPLFECYWAWEML